MPIRFACPSCNQDYTVKDTDAGKKAACKKCGQRLQVPAPPRSKTVLGELLPDSSFLKQPALPTQGTPSRSPPMLGRLEALHQPATTSSATGPIRFECPGCAIGYAVNRVSAGKTMECRSCGRKITVPGRAEPGDEPRVSAPLAPLPVAPFVEDEEPPPSEPESYHPAYVRSHRASNGPVCRVMAGVGAGLLFIGLFLPMIHGPLGFWMSFIDFPWKAVTAGFAIADEIKETDQRAERPRADWRDRSGDPPAQPAKQPDGSGLAVLVAIGSVLYPLCMLAAIGFAGFQIACGRTAAAYLFAGLASAFLTFIYGLGILLLNTIPELRLVLALLSPGFGWAVMFIGSFMLVIAGVFRSPRRD